VALSLQVKALYKKFNEKNFDECSKVEKQKLG
jgi:hypothetical protein